MKRIPTEWGTYFHYLVETYRNKEVIEKFLVYIEQKETKLSESFDETTTEIH